MKNLFSRVERFGTAKVLAVRKWFLSKRLLVVEKLTNRFRERLYIFLGRNMALRAERVARRHTLTIGAVAGFTVAMMLLFALGVESNSNLPIVIAAIVVVLVHLSSFVFATSLRLSIQQENSARLAASIGAEFSEGSRQVLYPRKFSADLNIQLSVDRGATGHSLARFVYGGKSEGTIDEVLTKAAGMAGPVLKLANIGLDDFSVSTVPIEVGDEAWFDRFRSLADNSELILVLPFVNGRDSTLREIIYLKDNHLLGKTLFVMPTSGDLIWQGRAEKIEVLWSASRQTIFQETNVKLPEFHKIGGLIEWDGENFKLNSIVAGRLWFSRPVLRHVIQEGSVATSLFTRSLRFAIDATFIPILFSLLVALFSGFALLFLVFGVATALELEVPSAGDSQIASYLLLLFFSVVYFVGIWGCIQRHFDTTGGLVLALLLCPGLAMSFWLCADLIFLFQDVNALSLFIWFLASIFLTFLTYAAVFPLFFSAVKVSRRTSE